MRRQPVAAPLRLASIGSLSSLVLACFLLQSAYPRAGQAEVLIWQDSFESYSHGAYPGAGGWALRYGGAGTNQQFVDTTEACSGSRSLHLMGSSCWSANAYHALPSIGDSCQLSYQASIYVDEWVGSGCTPAVAWLGASNPSVGSWGQTYGALFFDVDGWIHADTTGAAGGPRLVPYLPGEWHSVSVEADLRRRTFSVIVDGERCGSELPIRAAGNPAGFEVTAGHGNPSPVAWFDDLVVRYGTTKLVGIPSDGPVASRLSLAPASANPFRKDVDLRFAIPAEGRATISVHDVSGRRLVTLLDEFQPAGTHSCRWDGRAGDGQRVRAGLYLVRLEAGARAASTRVVVLE